MNIDDYVMSETMRQGGTVFEAVGMRTALQNVGDVRDLREASKVLDYCAWKIKNLRGIRTTPVIFADLSLGSDARFIPAAMSQVLEFVRSQAFRGTLGKVDTDLVCKEILNIHPWEDGNGRIVSVFRNWLLGTTTDPMPLPYYFGEDKR